MLFKLRSLWLRATHDVFRSSRPCLRDFICSTVRALCCCNFCFSACHTFLMRECVLQRGRSRAHTVVQRRQAVCLAGMSLAKMAAYAALTPPCTFGQVWALPPQPTPTPSQTLAFEARANKIWMVLFVFSPRCPHSHALAPIVPLSLSEAIASAGLLRGTLSAFGQRAA